MWTDCVSSACYGSDQRLEGTGHEQLACFFPGAMERSWTTKAPCLLHASQNKNKARMKEAFGYVEDSRAWGGGGCDRSKIQILPLPFLKI